jgi:hypothetical protein
MRVARAHVLRADARLPIAAHLQALPVASVMRFTHAVINIVLIVATVRVLHSWCARSGAAHRPCLLA